MSFTLEIPIRFGDCDPAGMLYYPRFFDLFHQAMEEWFGAELGLPYQAFIRERQLGLPSVRAEADYRSPCVFGERVAVAVGVERVGRSSVVLAYVVSDVATGAVRARGRTVCVVMDLDPTSPRFRQAVPVPDDLRARLEPLVG